MLVFWRALLGLFGMLLLPSFGLALGQPSYVQTEKHAGNFVVAEPGRATALYVDADDFAGVTRAATDLQMDIQRVTGLRPTLLHDVNQIGASAVLVGTLGKSALIDRLVRESKLDVAQRQHFSRMTCRSPSNP
jgi:hypothetical protein